MKQREAPPRTTKRKTSERPRVYRIPAGVDLESPGSIAKLAIARTRTTMTTSTEGAVSCLPAELSLIKLTITLVYRLREKTKVPAELAKESAAL
jgi:hypothetical protein